MKETRHDESGGSVRIRFLVRAPAKRLWNVIASCPSAYRYLDGLEACEILVDETDRALTRQVIDPGFFAPTLDYTFETLRVPYERMDVVLVEGNLKQLDAYWRFHEVESGLLVEHELHVQPRMPVPRWLVRRTLKKDLPQMMLCMRGLAGGSLTPESEESDLAACQDQADHQ